MRVGGSAGPGSGSNCEDGFDWEGLELVDLDMRPLLGCLWRKTVDEWWL